MKAANGQLNCFRIGRVSWSVGQLQLEGTLPRPKYRRVTTTGMLLEALWDFAGAFGAGSWFFERKKIENVHF